MKSFDGLGRALRWMRETKGRRQFDVARAAGITRPMLSAYETGKQRPTLDTLDRILSALGSDLRELFEALRLVTGRPPAPPPAQPAGSPPLSPPGPTVAELEFLVRALEGRVATVDEEEQAFAALLRAVYRWLISVRQETLRKIT